MPGTECEMWVGKFAVMAVGISANISNLNMEISATNMEELGIS